jgi:hypothetical protein
MSNSNIPISKSPLSGSDPISQYNELIGNIYLLRNNIAFLAEKLGEQVPIMNIPCEFSKFLTNSVCSITDKITDGSISNTLPFNPVNYDILKGKLTNLTGNLTQTATNLEEKVKSGLINTTNEIKKDINNAVETSKDISKKVNELPDQKINEAKNKGVENIKSMTDKVNKTAEKSIKKLIGGNINNKYSVIVNPESGRLVKVNTKKGKEILNKYKKNI